ncbi:hypothetical protein HPB50_017883 [Hyalomma asiaticum]|uniref:Uncharacterized protein n=1 Tax=Hyalomma asiaticum TaxID=266040 RepID=A0ACB7T512_HYAAI|nr:hypothetical protein HPB50_017883 [Hyalomma asiaticum]
MFSCARSHDIVDQCHQSCAMQAIRGTGGTAVSSRLDSLLTFLSNELKSLETSDFKDNRGREVGTTLPASQFTHVRHGKPRSLCSTVTPSCETRKQKCVFCSSSEHRPESCTVPLPLTQKKDTLKGQEVFPLHNQRTSGSGLHKKDLLLHM